MNLVAGIKAVTATEAVPRAAAAVTAEASVGCGLDGVNGKAAGESGCGNGNSASSEKGADLFERATDTFLCGVVADAERGTDIVEIFLLEIAEQNGVAFGFGKMSERSVEVGSDFFPGRRVV